MRIVRRLLTLASAASALFLPASAHAAADRLDPVPPPSPLVGSAVAAAGILLVVFGRSHRRSTRRARGGFRTGEVFG
jgi:hypothetical protein